MAYPSILIDELARRGWVKNADGALVPPETDHRSHWNHQPYLVDPDEALPPLPGWMANADNRF